MCCVTQLLLYVGEVAGKGRMFIDIGRFAENWSGQPVPARATPQKWPFMQAYAPLCRIKGAGIPRRMPGCRTKSHCYPGNPWLNVFLCGSLRLCARWAVLPWAGVTGLHPLAGYHNGGFG